MRGGLVVCAAVLALAGCGSSDDGERERPTTVEAVFENAPASLRAGDPVRVAGVEVGVVESVRRDEGDTVVEMRQKPRLPSGDWPTIASEAHARILPRIFEEGRFFIDLGPTTKSGNVLRDGDRIPASRTSVAPESILRGPVPSGP